MVTLIITLVTKSHDPSSSLELLNANSNRKSETLNPVPSSRIPSQIPYEHLNTTVDDINPGLP